MNNHTPSASEGDALHRSAQLCKDPHEVSQQRKGRPMTIIITKTKLALGILAMVLVGATVVAASDGVFTDNPSGTYYHDPVEWAYDNGITTGTSATTFSPMDPVTRGQNVTFAYRYDQNIVQPALEDIEENVATLASDVSNAPRVYFARVNSDGTVEKGNGITVEKGDDGIYTLTLPEDANNCAVSADLYSQGTSDLSAGFYRLAAVTGFVIPTHTDAEDNPAEEVDVVAGFIASDDSVTFSDFDFSVTAYCSDPFIIIDPGFTFPPIWDLLDE